MAKKFNVKEEEISEFNSAVATLIRIDAIKRGLIEATLSNNYEMQFKYLVVYYKELVSMMSNEDDEKQKKRFYEVRENYIKYKEALRTGKTTIPRYIPDSFNDWEIELRNMEQKYGMGMPTKETIDETPEDWT